MLDFLFIKFLNSVFWVNFSGKSTKVGLAHNSREEMCLCNPLNARLAEPPFQSLRVFNTHPVLIFQKNNNNNNTGMSNNFICIGQTSLLR